MKKVILGVTGCIAAFKACSILSSFQKKNVETKVIVTDSALEFVGLKSLEVLSKNKVAWKMFDQVSSYDVEHISLSKWGDVLLIAPATANAIGKFAHGIADDMLSTVFLAFGGKKILCPAMNTQMYENEIFQSNLKKLQDMGVEVIAPVTGNLACGDSGKGKMEDPETIVSKTLEIMDTTNEFEGKTAIVTAGGTKEDIDGVRFISNYSSGKMGLEIAKEFERRGGRVIFIHGSVQVPIPNFYKVVEATSTCDMLNACNENFKECDIIVKAAAPCDFRVENKAQNKIKEKTLSLNFVPNPDIAKTLGEKKGDKILVIFSAETENLIENAKGKLKTKNADFVVANQVNQKGAGFGSDTNIVTIIDERNEKSFSLMSKHLVAAQIVNKIKEKMNDR